MNYQALFADMINDGRLPHAILLECMDSAMREQAAVYIAQVLLCTGKDKPCGECVPCVKLLGGNHPDVYFLVPERESRIIKVDMIRTMRDDAFLKPNEAKYKIYIISSADTMNENAQNAMLKILEEPPQNVFFILTCSSADKLLNTILSRVEKYNLNDTDSTAYVSAQDTELIKAANDIANAICCDKELDLLTAANALINVKKDIPQILDILAVIVRNACLIQYGLDTGSAQDDMLKASQRLASEKKRTSLLNIIDKIHDAKEKTAQNVNINLFVTWLCAELRRI